MQIANIYVHFTSLLWKRVGGRQCPTGDMGCYWLSSESSEFPPAIPRAIRFKKGPISSKRRIKCLVWGPWWSASTGLASLGLFPPLASPHTSPGSNQRVRVRSREAAPSHLRHSVHPGTPWRWPAWTSSPHPACLTTHGRYIGTALHCTRHWTLEYVLNVG